MGKLNGKAALITGASRGIGRAIAERLATEGAAVVINYTSNASAAQRVADGIIRDGGKATCVQADVGVRADVAKLFDEAEARLGKLDVVVASAGVSLFKPHALVTEAELDRLLAVNTRGVFFVLQEAAKRLRDGGRIIHVSTGGTAMPYPAAGAYAGSKAAAEQFVASLSKELGQRQITVNSVSPGATETDGLIMPQEAIERLVAQTPLGRLGQPRDIADAIAFLATDDARWITGQNLRVTGGVV